MIIQGPNYKLNLRQEFISSMTDILRENVESIPSRVSRLLISEYAGKRILPPGSPRPGPWDNKVTPYLVETMNNMSPISPVQREIILKAAQGGWTALAEIALCYFMDESPADILFMSAGDELLERWATRRLEPAIDSFGIREKLTVSHENGAKSRRSGDKTFSKDFFGGRMDMASARSASKQRATDKRILIRDEIDGVPSKLTTGEGYWLDVSKARTNSWGVRRKILDFGTPSTFEKSEIWKAYLMGDQRKFMVPCPRCGTFQYLEFGREETQHGIKPVHVAGKLVDAVYMCEHCHDAIHNTEKRSVFGGGYWEPTTEASEDFWVSRHWNSCYSPFLSFRELWKEYENAREKPEGMRSFTNLYEGLPYKEEGSKLSATRVLSLRSTYNSGTVPHGVLFTTMAVDVQRGSDSDPSNPPRLELEVCGHGVNYKTWSINYIRIDGSVENPFGGAWETLYDMLAEGEFNYPGPKGVLFRPKRVFIDSGYASHVVYKFAERVSNTFAVKGQGSNYKADGDTDVRKQNSDRRYKVSKNVDATRLYLIATNEYKRIMRSALKVQRLQTEKEQSSMFCEFPVDYDKVYFDMLTAEEMLTDGSFKAYGRKTEATDCRVYNLCAAESYLNDYVYKIRENYRKSGYLERDVKAITKTHVLTKLRNQLDIDISKV